MEFERLNNLNYRFFSFSKIILFISIFIFIQAYHAAPLSDAETRDLRTELENVPGVDTKAIESIVTTLKKYEDDPVSIAIMSF